MSQKHMATDSVKIQEKAADVLRIMKEEVASVAGSVRKSLNAMRPCALELHPIFGTVMGNGQHYGSQYTPFSYLRTRRSKTSTT